MLLALEICENTIRAWKFVGMLLYILKVSVGLIVIVTSTITVGTVVAKGTADSMTKAMIGIAKKIAAAIIVFYIPTVVTVSVNLFAQTQDNSEFEPCEACIKEPNSSTCTKYIVAYDEREQQEIQKFKEDELSGSVNTCEMGLSSSPPLDFSYRGNGSVKAQFSSDNLKIIEKHINDFNSNNFHSYINSVGGFKKYTQKLGGIYQNYFEKNWEGKTIEDLQMASEYVFGYMTMYGFDYFNGRDYPAGNGQKYCKWGGSCVYYTEMEAAQKKDPPQTLEYPGGTSDSFYPGNTHYDEHGLSGPLSDFDKIIQGDNMTTNCNWTVDMVYWKAGIFRNGTREDGTPEFQSCTEWDKLKKYGKVITRLCDLKVGDILHFYSTPIDHTNIATWNSSEWKHVAFIGEIDGETGTITAYDGGSYLTRNRNHKWTFSGKGEWPTTLHGYAGWGAIRVKELTT